MSMRPSSSYRICFLKKHLCIRHIKAKNTTIYLSEEVKQNKNKIFLKILCSKHFLVPILGMLFIILNFNLTYNGNSTSELQHTDRCSRNLYGKQLSINTYQDPRNPIVISQVFGLPNEKPTFTLEGIPEIDYTNILAFNEKLMKDANRYNLVNNYDAIPHVNEFKPLIVDNELFEYNKKVDNIGRNGEDILTDMKTLWNEIMDINKKKYYKLNVKLRKTYYQYRSECDMPVEVYINRWRQCLNIIKQGGHNLEERLNTQFESWYKQKYLYLEEFRRLTVLNQIVWKALSNQIEYSCKKIMTCDTTSFKRMNEFKKIKREDVKAYEKEKRRREQEYKEKSLLTSLFSCTGYNKRKEMAEESSLKLPEPERNEYGDILPSLKNCIYNLAINYYDTVQDGEYIDDESSDALYTEEEYWFDLEKQTYMNIMNMRQEEKSQSQQYQRVNETQNENKTQEVITTKQENIGESSKKVEKQSEVDKTIYFPDTRFYDILGVDINADMNEIDKCYYKLAKKHYPINGSTLDDLKKFKEINEAYQILGDIDNKRKYTKYGYNGIKKFNFINPSLFYFFSCLKKYDFYTGTPHIISILKFLFEKKLTMDDLESKSAHILRVMNEYQKEIEVTISLRLLDKIQPNIDGIKNWDTLIIEEIKGLLKSHFTLPILNSMAYIFTNVSQCYIGNQEKAKKEIENRFKKNKFNSSRAYNELRYTLREYFKSRKQVSSLSYTLENNNKKYIQNKWSKNIHDLKDKKKYKILGSFVKNILIISLSDMEYTIKTVCERILTEEGIDDMTIIKRAESLYKLGYLIRENILKHKNIKKIIKCDTRNISEKIVNEISTINKLLE